MNEDNDKHFFQEFSNEERAFKKINENPIILDFKNCKYCGTVHKILKKKFGLPEYYGENWDALWDCLRYLWIWDEDVSVEIHNFYSMNKDIQEYCKPMFKVFEDVHSETPNVTFEVVS